MIDKYNFVGPNNRPTLENVGMNDIILIQEYIDEGDQYLPTFNPYTMSPNDAEALFKRYPNSLFVWISLDKFPIFEK